jgi:hypothetical protein
MKCEDVLDMLQRTGAGAEGARRAADEHLADCEDCRNAAHALAVLRADRDLSIPSASAGAFARAMHTATSPRGRPRDALPRRKTFWLGAVTGGAIAAGIVAAVMIMRPLVIPSEGAPAVTLAVNEARDVSVALRSAEPLVDAEIRVSLSGEIALQGFDDQRELHWRTDLDRGVNELKLPVVALGASGGQVLVEVQHGDKRRSFVVDVHAVPSKSPEASIRARDVSPLRASVGKFEERGRI